MVEDMLQVLASVPGIDGVLLVSDDSTADLLAYRYNVRLLAEDSPSRGLNAAVTQGAAHLRGLNASHMLVLHGDLPLIRAEDIGRLIADLPPSDSPLVRLVADASNEGSNALLCSLPAPIDFCYGPDSFERHRLACARRRVAWQQYSLASMALDIDRPRDLQALIRGLFDPGTAGAGSKTAAMLEKYAVDERLRQMKLASSSDVATTRGPARGADGVG
jgi:2-phospho-L-lactate guanylyltransferase